MNFEIIMILENLQEYINFLKIQPHDYFEAHEGWCMGAQEAKKSKIAKNGLKRTETSIEVHIKVYWIGPGTVRYHMSQPKRSLT